jgi:hypothetical protein
MSESKFKGSAIKDWRSQGLVVQCFEDKLSAGIADSFIGWPGGGLWIEWKWVQIPARGATPLPVEFRPGQLPWLKQFHGKPLPTCVVVGSDKGYLVVPGPKAPELLEKASKDWIWIDDKPTIPMIVTALRCHTK